MELLVKDRKLQEMIRKSVKEAHMNKCGDCVKYYTDECKYREEVDYMTHNCPCFEEGCKECRLEDDLK